MDSRELKMLMRAKTRLARGLSNLLKDDAEQLSDDMNNFDILRMEETVTDAKRTAQQMIDAMTELEYYLYLAKKDA